MSSHTYRDHTIVVSVNLYDKIWQATWKLGYLDDAVTRGGFWSKDDALGYAQGRIDEYYEHLEQLKGDK